MGAHKRPETDGRCGQFLNGKFLTFFNSFLKLLTCRGVRNERSKSVNYWNTDKESIKLSKPRSFSQDVLSSGPRRSLVRQTSRNENYIYGRPSLRRNKYGSARYSKFWEQTFCVILFFFLSIVLVILIICLVSLMQEHWMWLGILSFLSVCVEIFPCFVKKINEIFVRHKSY